MALALTVRILNRICRPLVEATYRTLMRRHRGYPSSVEVSLELESLPGAAHLAREEVQKRLRQRLPRDSLLSLLVIVSELVTNSVRHGPGKPIRLRVTVDDDGSVRGEVEDHGDGEIAIREITDGGGGGFGLRIVERLADRWGVYENSTHVWFELAA